MAEIPVIKQGGKLYSIAELKGKTLVSARKLRLYKKPYSYKQVVFTNPIASKTGVYSNEVGTKILNYKNRSKVDYTTKSIGEFLGIFTGGTAGGIQIMPPGKSGTVNDYQFVPYPFYKYSDSAYTTFENSIGIMPSGNNIGVLDTWVSGKDEKGNDTTEIFLQFVSALGKNYFVLLLPNTFETSNLKEQGAQTVQEQKDEKEENEMDFGDKALKVGKTIGMLAIGAFLISKLIERGRSN